MKGKVTAATLLLSILVLSLAFSTPSYAKLVVLSFGFDNSTEGFTSTTTSNCGDNFTVTPSGDGLVVSANSPTQCAGTFQIDKLVVLSSAVTNPSLDISIADASNSVNNSSTAAIGNLNGNLRFEHGNGRSNGSTAALNGNANGQVRLRYTIHYTPRTTSFTIAAASVSGN